MDPHEFRLPIVLAGVLLAFLTLVLWALFTMPGSTVTTFYDNGHVMTQNGPPVIQHGWHVAESILLGAWTVFGFIAGALWGDLRDCPACY